MFTFVLCLQHQFDEDEDQHESSWIDTSKNVSVISQAEFDKLKTNSRGGKIVPGSTPNNLQPPPPPLNTPAAANGEIEPPTGSRHVKPNQPHFYPVTKEPTTPSQV